MTSVAVDLRRSVSARIVDEIDADDAAPGDLMVVHRSNDRDGPLAGYAYRCVGCGQESYIPLQPRPAGSAGWTVSAGDPRRADDLSLSPSIHHAAPQGCGWHGWLRNGVFVPC